MAEESKCRKYFRNAFRETIRLHNNAERENSITYTTEVIVPSFTLNVSQETIRLHSNAEKENPMNYTPKSEEQLVKEGLLDEGIYDFEIIDTNDAPSKKGNDMFTLTLCVFDHDGGQRKIFDYIALGSNFGERKLRRAAIGCGLLDVYMTGDLQHHTFMGATGKVQVKQREGTPDFPLPKNIVGDYIPRDDGETADKRPVRDIISDDLPF